MKYKQLTDEQKKRLKEIYKKYKTHANIKKSLSIKEGYHGRKV